MDYSILTIGKKSTAQEPKCCSKCCLSHFIFNCNKRDSRRKPKNSNLNCIIPKVAHTKNIKLFLKTYRQAKHYEKFKIPHNPHNPSADN